MTHRNIENIHLSTLYSDYKETKMQKTNKKHLATGFVSGMVSRTVTHPLERVRLLHQVGSKSFMNKTICQSINHIYSESGARGLLKGNTLNCMH